MRRGAAGAGAAVALALLGGLVAVLLTRGEQGPAQWPTYLVYLAEERDLPDSEYVHFEHVDSLDAVHKRAEAENVVGVIFDRGTADDLARSVAGGWVWDRAFEGDEPAGISGGGRRWSIWVLDVTMSEYLYARRDGIWPAPPGTHRRISGGDGLCSGDPQGRCVIAMSSSVIHHDWFEGNEYLGWLELELRGKAEAYSLGCVTSSNSPCDAPDGLRAQELADRLAEDGLMPPFLQPPARQ